MMAFILATDFDFIVLYEQNGLFWEAFCTPMAFLEYDLTDPHGTNMAPFSISCIQV